MQKFIKVLRISLGVVVILSGFILSISVTFLSWQMFLGVLVSMLGFDLAGIPLTRKIAAFIGGITGSMIDTDRHGGSSD